MNKTIIKSPSKGLYNKNLVESKTKQTFKNYLSNPLGQFVLLGVVLIILGFLARFKVIPYSLNTALAKVIIHAIIAIGFCLLLGYSGLASLGTAGFAGLGAYATYFILQHTPLSFLSSLIASVVFALIFGLFVGIISLRIEGMYLAILTLGLAEILFQVFKNIEATIKINSSNITFFFMKLDKMGLFTLITVMFVILLILTSNIINSPTGRAMLAMKNSTSAAQAMGIGLLKYRLLAFVISTIYAAIGGMLYIMLIGVETPSQSQFLALSMSLNILGAVIVGGSRSLWGTIFGSFIIFGAQSIIFNNIPFFQQNPQFIGIVTGILLVVIVMFYPGGLSQLALEVKLKIRKLIMKWRTKKYGTN